MELDPAVTQEWLDTRSLTPHTLRWIEEHADPGDDHPVITAISQLRAEQVDRLTP